MTPFPDSLRASFLIAMPALKDPNFDRTVTLICEHSDQGAMGIVINRAMDLSFGDVLEQLGIEPGVDREPTRNRAFRDRPVYAGGPVQGTRGFVLHDPLGSWESTMKITDTLGVSTSRDILEAIARHEGPEHWMLVLGYAGWSAGQLEQEIAGNAWLNGPSSEDVLFRVPTPDRWSAAVSLAGVNLTRLSSEAGHA